MDLQAIWANIIAAVNDVDSAEVDQQLRILWTELVSGGTPPVVNTLGETYADTKDSFGIIRETRERIELVASHGMLCVKERDGYYHLIGYNAMMEETQAFLLPRSCE